MAVAAICTATGNGSWTAPATWSGCGGGVPGAADTARINGGSAVQIPAGVAVTVAAIEFGATGSPALTVDGALTVGNVVHHGNTVDGLGAITVTGTYDWLGNGPLQGTLRPDGTAPPLTFAPGSVWNLSATTMPLRRRAVVQQGAANFNAGAIGCSSTVTWLIAPGAVLIVSHAGSIGSGGVDCRIRNEGTIRKTGAGTTFRLTDSRVLLENHGLLEVVAGGFDFDGGGGPTAHSGTFRTEAGAVLGAPRAAVAFQTGTAFEGAGTVQFGASGVSTFASSLDFPGLVRVMGSSADLAAPAGVTLGFQAGLEFTTGRLSGPGSFRVPAGRSLTLTGAGPKLVGSGAQLLLEGSTSWQAGELSLQTTANPIGTRLFNAPGGDFQVLFRPARILLGDNAVLENAGSFSAVASAQTGALTLGSGVRGTVLNTGTLSLAGAVTSETRSWRMVAGQLSLDDVRMTLTTPAFNFPMTLEGGVVTGTAQLTGAVRNTGALILPGGVDAIGAFGVEGYYEEQPGAAMELDVAGLTPDAHDRFVVTGTPGRIDLRGDIEVNRLGGSQFAATDAITLVDAVTAPATSVPAGVSLDPGFAPLPQVRLDRSRVVLAIDQLFADDLEPPVPALPTPDTVFAAALE